MFFIDYLGMIRAGTRQRPTMDRTLEHAKYLIWLLSVMSLYIIAKLEKK